jgi:hypothetical protein
MENWITLLWYAYKAFQSAFGTLEVDVGDEVVDGVVDVEDRLHVLVDVRHLRVRRQHPHRKSIRNNKIDMLGFSI